MASPVEQVRRALNSDATKANLFRLLENEAFHLEPVAALYPELAEHWQKLADAMQVPWQFVMVLDLTMAAVKDMEPNVSLSGGSGSLEGEGKQMALARNLGRSISFAFLTEGKRLLRWLQNEGSVNETIVLELFERMLWKRSTVNADKSFIVNRPYFLAAGALHVEDVIELFVGNDPLGIRGRLGLFYARATFKRASDVRAAAESLTTRRLVRGLELLLLRALATARLSGGVFRSCCASVLLYAGKPTIPSTAHPLRSSTTFAEASGGSTSWTRLPDAPSTSSTTGTQRASDRPTSLTSTTLAGTPKPRRSISATPSPRISASKHNSAVKEKLGVAVCL